MSEKAYTTFQIAQICGVRPTTIIKWIKEKKLRAYVTLGGHRRVLEGDLVVFLKEHGFPMPAGLGKKRRVLIIEDEPAVGRVLERALGRALGSEAEVRWVTDGIEGLLGLGKDPADLVVLDVVMPVIDGARVLATLRSDERTRQTKVIGMTGKRLQGEKLQFMLDHTDAFFYKPFDTAAVIQKCSQLLELPLSAPESPKEKTRGNVRVS